VMIVSRFPPKSCSKEASKPPSSCVVDVGIALLCEWEDVVERGQGDFEVYDVGGGGLHADAFEDGVLQMLGMSWLR
jgi:hypothetical protein